MTEPSAERRRASTAVEWLRKAHEDAGPGHRARPAGLLGLALADLTDLLDDGDQALPDLLQEGLDRVAEARADPTVAAALGVRLPLRSGELRLRSGLLGHSDSPHQAGLDGAGLDGAGLDAAGLDAAGLEQVVADLTEALGPPWSTPPEVVPLAASRWCLVIALVLRHARDGRDDDLAVAAAHTLEAAAEQESAAGRQALTAGGRAALARWRRRGGTILQQNPRARLTVPVAHWAQAAPRARHLLGVVGPGHPLRGFLRVMSVTDVLQDMARTERWPDRADTLLADLQAVPELWGDDASAIERRVARALALQLGCARLYLLARQAPDPGCLDLTVLDALLAEFDALSEEPEPSRATPAATDEVVIQGARRAVERSRFLLGGLLLTRAAVANAEDRPPDPVDLARSRELLQGAPPEMAREAQAVLAALPLIRPDVDDLPWVPDLVGTVGAVDPDYHDLGGGRIAVVLARARHAIAARDPQAIFDVRPALEDTLRALPATHPAYPELLALQANLSGLQALLDGDSTSAAGALHVAVRAAEIAALLEREQNRQVCDSLALNLVAAIGHDLPLGPFDRAQLALESALAAGLADDDAQRLQWTIGAAAAAALRWPALDEDARQATRELVTEAERRLRAMPADPVVVGTGFMLFMVLANLGVPRADPGARVAVVRVLDHLEERLARPGLADAMMAMTGAGMMPVTLPGGMPLPPGAAGLRVVVTQLRQSLNHLVVGRPPPMPAPPSATEVELRVATALRVAAQALDDPARPAGPARLAEATGLLGRVLAAGVVEPVHQDRLHAALGRCLAAAAGVVDDAPARPGTADDVVRLAEAVRHLELATVQSAGAIAATDHADLLDLLARCHRAGADPGRAVPAARAALREVLSAVLVATEAEEAVAATARAHRISLRAAWWCVRDGDLEQAVGLAEAGRALVLASVVLAGRVQEQLRATGREDLADGWATGDRAARSATLGELLTTYPGFAALATPKPGQLAATVVGTSMDAVAYLLPPVEDEPDGVMLLVGRDRGVRAVPLPGLRPGPGSPLDRYRQAFGAATARPGPPGAGPDPAASGTAPPAFQETPQGREWLAALEDLGNWAHRAVIVPLLGHVHGWQLGRTPHITLVPLGDLGLIPFAAAWTPDATRPSGRRYAVHDLVLSYIPSGRMLADVVQRDRLPLRERIVLVPDPSGELPHARLAAHAVRKALFPEATCYELETDTLPTRANLLGALPAPGRDGASLLHLSTHGLAAPLPLDSTLLAGDGTISVREILTQAAGRDRHAPGGLVISDACLTDVTHSRPDESLTLATAFLTAGATGVIGTRWPVDDGAAAALVNRLHHGLAAGRSPAQALRLAQIAVLDGEPAPPGTPVPLVRAERARGAVDWAAFVHHGA